MGERAILNSCGRFLKGRRAWGFTLVEVMIALVVLALGMMGSVIGIVTAHNYGIKNEMRGEAVKIAQEQEEAVRNMPYTQVSAFTQQLSITRQVRNALITYTVTPAVTAVPASQSCGGNCAASLVQLTVAWSFKGAQCVPYVLQTIVRQAQ